MHLILKQKQMLQCQLPTTSKYMTIWSQIVNQIISHFTNLSWTMHDLNDF